MVPDPKPTYKKIRQKTCKQCKNKYIPENEFSIVCSGECALAYIRSNNLKTMRKRLATEKDAMKTKADYIRELQTEFNKLIRIIDQDLPCIARGYLATDKANTWDAGHCYSIGSVPALRFWAHNVHKQHKQSNRYKAGDPLLFVDGLISRYGQKYVDDLRDAKARFQHMNWSITQLRDAKAECMEMIRMSKKGVIPTRDEINEKLSLYLQKI